MLLGLAWMKWGKKLLPLLIPLHAIQMVFYVLYFIYNEATLNIFMFWLIGFINTIFIGALADKVYLIAAYWFFKDSQERASFENLENMASCLATCIGSLIAVIYVPTLRIALFCDFISMFVWCVLVLYFSIPRRKVLTEPDPEDLLTDESAGDGGVGSGTSVGEGTAAGGGDGTGDADGAAGDGAAGGETSIAGGTSTDQEDN